MGAKRAVLIGINYPGTKAELRGCVNDAMRMHKCLIERYGFEEENITTLIDTDPAYTQPTGKNIRAALSKLVASGSPGDLLFVHYSGHGTRIPPESGEQDDTGYDECIVPTDMNLITDDDIRDFVDKVPDGCFITIISDSCHSGGLIDEAKEQIGESTKKQASREVKTEAPSFGFRSIMSTVVNTALESRDIKLGFNRSKHEEHEQVRDLPEGEAYVKSRSLPISTLIEILQQKTGKQDIDIGKLRMALYDMFGEDSSPKVKKVMNLIMDHFQDGKGKTGIGGLVGNLAQGFLKMGMDQGGGGSAKPAVKTQTQSVNTGSSSRPMGNNGILISGCQSDQTSADATPSGNPKGAYGALSNAIQTLLSESQGPVSNRELVMGVRKMLEKQGFTQRPGLYCSDDTLNSPFVC